MKTTVLLLMLCLSAQASPNGLNFRVVDSGSSVSIGGTQFWYDANVPNATAKVWLGIPVSRDGVRHVHPYFFSQMFDGESLFVQADPTPKTLKGLILFHTYCVTEQWVYPDSWQRAEGGLLCWQTVDSVSAGTHWPSQSVNWRMFFFSVGPSGWSFSQIDSGVAAGWWELPNEQDLLDYEYLLQ